MRRLTGAALTGMVVVAVPLTATPSSAATGVAGPPVLTAAAPTSGRLAVALLDVPVSERKDPRARVYIVDQVRPGTRIARRVRISDQSNAAMAVSAYVGPARIAGGSFIFGPRGSTSDLTSWSSVSRAALPLAAGHSRDVAVTIAVPKDATNGERYGVVWAEISSKSRPGATTEVNRVGVRIYLDVYGGRTAQRSSFTITDLVGARSPTTMVPVATAHVRNTGQRALDLSGTLRLTHGPSGLSAGPFHTQQATTIAPGGTAAVVFTLDRSLPDGPWHARLDLASGDTMGHKDATITFASPHRTVVAPTRSGSGFPWAWLLAGLGAVLIVLLVALALWLLRRRRRRAERTPSGSTRPAQ